MYSCVIFLILGVCAPLVYLGCVPRDYGLGGTVCVCNAAHCDYFDPIYKVNQPKILVYTSNMDGLRFHHTSLEFKNISHKNLSQEPDITVKRYRTYQKVFGFGGAFTDATGINIDSLSDGVKNHLLRSYFAKEGIEYSLCRVPVGGTDFSMSVYSYDDGEADPQLKRFALNEADYKYKIPYMKLAQNLTNGRLEFLASAWTAPTWMKTNGRYVGGTLKPEMYEVWAKYYVKFFNEYKKHGIKFWGVTTGNEPSMAKFPAVLTANISSIGWTSNTLATWVAEALGPILHKSGYGNITIMALDDNRYYLPWFMERVFRNEAAKRYIKGTAVHWYYADIYPVSILQSLHDKFPDKFIISTEACSGASRDIGVRLGSWSRGEDYAQDIIEDMRHWVTGWIDWNMALNTKGGPTSPNGIVDSPIIVNGSANEFYKQPMYYALGHFAKFVPKHSIRIDSTDSSKVWSVAFRRPDNGTVVVVLNRKKVNQNIIIADDSKGVVTINVTGRSLTTLVYW